MINTFIPLYSKEYIKQCIFTFSGNPPIPSATVVTLVKELKRAYEHIEKQEKHIDTFCKCPVHNTCIPEPQEWR